METGRLQLRDHRDAFVARELPGAWAEVVLRGEQTAAMERTLTVGEACREYLDAIRARGSLPLWVVEVTKSWDTPDQCMGPTKTGEPRRHPVLPAVRTVLEEFLAAGWRGEVGRQPTDRDILLPARPRGVRPRVERVIEPRRWRNDTLRKCFVADRKRLGIDRAMSPKDLRRTWRSLANEAGVPKETRDRITHARSKDVSALYDEHEFALISKAVLPIALTYSPPASGPREQLALFTPKGPRP